jgi:hypothetical protein
MEKTSLAHSLRGSHISICGSQEKKMVAEEANDPRKAGLMGKLPLTEKPRPGCEKVIVQTGE